MLHGITLIRNVLKFIVPYVLLYSLYIQINGEISPGGGFQAGSIFATGLIIFDLVNDKVKLKNIFNTDILVLVACLGVFIYFLVGAAGIFSGGNYLDYNVIFEDDILGQHVAITVIELGVGITVASVMCLIYSLLKIK